MRILAHICMSILLQMVSNRHTDVSRGKYGLQTKTVAPERRPRVPCCLLLRGGSDPSSEPSRAASKSREKSDAGVPEWLDKLVQQDDGWAGGSGVGGSRDELLGRWLPTISEWAEPSDDEGLQNITDLADSDWERASASAELGEGDGEAMDSEELAQRVEVLEAGVREVRRCAEDHMAGCNECRIAAGEANGRDGKQLPACTQMESPVSVSHRRCPVPVLGYPISSRPLQ
jgi:hypothetical protein